MNIKKFKQFRLIVAIFILIFVFIFLAKNNYLVSGFLLVAGLLSIIFVRAKTILTEDEREINIREKSAQITLAICMFISGISSFVFLFFNKFLATIFIYITLFLISVFSISYHFVNRKFGGDYEK